MYLGEQPGEYKDFLFEPNVHLHQNGSLTFTHVIKDSEGQYLCEGKNTIGSGVSKVIFLKVNGKWYILYYHIWKFKYKFSIW